MNARILAHLSVAQIKQISNKDKSIVLLSLGAVEQHGPHLPVGTDYFLAQSWCNRLLAEVNPDFNIYVGDIIAITNSSEHMSFAGTLSFDIHYLENLLFHYCKQYAAWGFSKILILSEHGGNIAALDFLIPNLRTAFPQLNIQTFSIFSLVKECRLGVDDWDIHAGEYEASLMLVDYPELVKMDKANRDGHLLAQYKYIGLGSKPINFIWLTQDITKSGTIGDATRATAQKGVDYFKAVLGQRVNRILATFKENKSATVH